MAIFTVRNDISYGALCVYEFEGVRFVANRSAGIYLNLLEVSVGEIPEFLTDIRMEVVSKNTINTALLWVIDRADIRKLGCGLSRRLGKELRVLYMQRTIGRFAGGALADGPQNMDKYYSGLSEQDIENGKF